jgi:Tol biopolymer transport system component
MPPSPGDQLGPYTITDKIGEGGMGEVYRATDNNLKRDVAIKFLPEAFTQDPERLARFQREAEVLAQLHHPNIASIFGIEESAGARALVMELVEGQTLAERLAQGRLSIDEALDLAKQIAVALEEAHAKGIVHRDLKPANVKLTPSGRVKVLDFGLAKALADEAAEISGDPSDSPTLTAATQAGMILGTAAYMSPEQARGEAVDKRADVWAFGCVLFEMLAGRTTFKENTVSDTLASVLKVEPEWSLLPEDTPHNVRLLLLRCIRKDLQQRLHDIADARIEIEETLETPPEKRALAPSSGSRARFPIGATAVLVAAGLAVGLLAGLRLAPSLPEQHVQRFFLPVEAQEGQQPIATPVLSPDGRAIVYVFDDKLWLRDLDQVAARPLDGTEGGRLPFWSPDGLHVGYRQNDSMWRIPVSGGQPALICAESKEFYPASWGDDGMIVFSTLNEIHEVSARGGEPKTILQRNPETEVHFHEACQLPGGRGLLLVVHRDDSPDTIALWGAGKRRNLLTLEGSDLVTPTYSPSGHILFTRVRSNEALWALPFSLSSLEATGEPFLVLPQGSQASASSDGTLVYMDSRARSGRELVWFDAEGTILDTIGQPQMDMEFPVISPDGTKVAVSGEEDKDWDIWIHEEMGRKGRITFDKGPEARPRWSRDGSRVFYHHPVGPNSSIYSVDSVAGGDRELLTEGEQASFARDESRMVFRRPGDGTMGDLWSMSLEGDGDAVVLLQNEADEKEPALSPDGRFLAYVSDESGTEQIYIKPFPEGSEKWQISFESGWRAYWSPAGDRLYYNSYGKIMELQVSTDPVLRMGTPRVFLDPDQTTLLPWLGIDIAEDGKRFVGIRNVKKDEDDDEVAEGIHVVLNWFSDFEE